MPLFRLTRELRFPNPSLADSSGLLAVGGDLSPERLLLAYSMGIFPWYEEGLPILWHSPDPRFVLELDDLHVNRSLRKSLNRFTVKFDTAFEEVVDLCARTKRSGQAGTWITRDQRDAFVELHYHGYAHSVEAWQGGHLAGGLYGLSLGSAFFGESMFHHVSNASKVALVRLVERLEAWSFSFIDCQSRTEHLADLGAKDIPREEFLSALQKALTSRTRQGNWGTGPSSGNGNMQGRIKP